VSKPRDRQNRLHRKHGIFRSAQDHVGVASMPETCPRCGEPCTHLVRAYYESPWNEHGGMCSQCCQEAVQVFESKGWPPDPRDAVAAPEKPTETAVQGDLLDQ
jgi:hypothetical protein